MADNLNLNYIEIVSSIRKQVSDLYTEILTYSSSTDPFQKELYDRTVGLRFFVSDEQSFVKLKNELDNAIHLVITFGNATVNFGNSVVPIYIKVIGSKNSVSPVQMFLGAFASKYSTKPVSQMANATQVWFSPVVNESFIEIDAGYRSLCVLNGTFVITQSVIAVGTLEYKYGNGATDIETIDILAFQDDYANQLAPQPFGNTFGFTKSEVNFSTYTFSITTYSLASSKLIEDCWAIKGFRNRAIGGTSRTKSPNDLFDIRISLTNGYTNFPSDATTDVGTIETTRFFQKFKVSHIGHGQKIGDTPTVTISFTH